MRKLFAFLIMMFCLICFAWVQAVPQHHELGQFPVMTAAAIATGEQNGITRVGYSYVSPEGSGLCCDYGRDGANPVVGHDFLPIHRSVETLFDETRRNTSIRDYDEGTGQAIGCRSTHWRYSELYPRSDAIVTKYDGRPGHNEGRRVLV